MSRLLLKQSTVTQQTMKEIYSDMERRIKVSPLDLCPVDTCLAFLKLCETATCGKCTPCRIGLPRLESMLNKILDNKATMDDLESLEYLAQNIVSTADCSIGKEAAKMVLKSLNGSREDYEHHINQHTCIGAMKNWIPCNAKCPANVDVPGYIALVKDKRYADAIRLIRKDNPFPTACGLVCEHPCENGCRRTLLDAPVDIRRLKRLAVEKAGKVKAPKCAPSTGKRIAIVGGGPSGLTAAYFLQLMGHSCTIFEKHKKLGGMLIYGIPSYRLPRKQLLKDIDNILSTGVEVKLNTEVDDAMMKKLKKEYDVLYIAIGAQMDKKIGIEGSTANGVMSAVEFLGKIGDDEFIDLKGKTVAVIGGGNVAMDCTRSAIRLGAESVKIVYRRRMEDMTALEEEILGAIAEGAEMVDMEKPLSILTDKKNNVIGLRTHTQIPGEIINGRMQPMDKTCDDRIIDCDLIIVAIGQSINTGDFEKVGLPIKRGVFDTKDSAGILGEPNVFAGGDCVTGPKTAIMAINAGKVAAANIDYALGFDHKISVNVSIPDPDNISHPYHARVKGVERPPRERVKDFELVECSMSEEEGFEEASRCLRCDHFGCGSFKGGRSRSW